nr:hypothetical protein [Allobaculum stercoricanis]
MDLSAVEQAGFTPLPAWQDALGRYLEVLKDMGEL